MIFYKKITLCMLIFCMFISLAAHDVLVELKGSAFVPTSEIFKDIYGSCGDFGAELTAGSLFDHVYAFSSIDFFVKNGSTLELASATKVTMVNFALGLKYFVPFHKGDFYLGLGVEPVHMTMKDDTVGEATQWGCGGIAKVGVIIDMPHSLFTDIFFNYSFVKFNSSDNSSLATPINGCLFGIGLGYRFN